MFRCDRRNRLYSCGGVAGGVCVLLAITGCGPHQDGGDRTRAAGDQQTTQLMDSAQRLDTSSQLEALVDSLAHVTGEFTRWESGRWEFSGDRSILGAFDRYGSRAVVQLVKCLDREEPTAARVRGRMVPHGVMCYWALRRLAYHESSTEDSAEPVWPGEITPTASMDELRAAKQAWERVVAEGTYRLT